MLEPETKGEDKGTGRFDWRARRRAELEAQAEADRTRDMPHVSLPPAFVLSGAAEEAEDDPELPTGVRQFVAALRRCGDARVRVMTALAVRPTHGRLWTVTVRWWIPDAWMRGWMSWHNGRAAGGQTAVCDRSGRLVGLPIGATVTRQRKIIDSFGEGE